jgi:DDE superfamily endonuclease
VLPAVFHRADLPGLRTVTGMLAGARLAGVWHHTRAHRFFAVARWSADQLGLGVCDLIVGRLLDPNAPICLVVDDSLFKRTGRKIHGAGWRHDATATGRKRTAWGNTWVVVGVLVDLPFVAHRRGVPARARAPVAAPTSPGGASWTWPASWSA